MTSAEQWDPAGNRLQKGYFQVIDYFDQNDISAAIRLGERVKSWAEKGVKIYPNIKVYSSDISFCQSYLNKYE